MTHLIGYVGIALATKKGNKIENERMPTMSPEQKESAISLSAKNNPRAKHRTSGDGYNCVGMVFGTRRTAIEPSLVDFILKDDEYSRIYKHAELMVGDLVVYRKSNQGEVDHIGLISNIDTDLTKGDFLIQILSAWGNHGEFFHYIDDVPSAYGKHIEFWTDRKK